MPFKVPTGFNGISDFLLDISKEAVPDHTGVNVVSHDTNIGTTISTIATNSGILQNYSTTADIDSISSENAGDTHDITIVGLDVNYVEVTQTATLNGQTRVALTAPLLRVNNVFNFTSTATLGDLWIYVNTAIVAGKPADLTQIRSSIKMIGTVSEERSATSVYTVPADKTGFIVFGKTTVSDSKSLELTFWGRQSGGLFLMQHHIDLKDNNYDYFFKFPLMVPEKADLEIRASVSSGSAEVSAVYDLILVNNDV